jgi:branched-chain amino acid transport system ATP-binding protein
MLDEPTAGVSPIVMDELFDRIIEVARTGISILMVEQNARQALEIADKGYVLVQGANRFTDTGAALLADFWGAMQSAVPSLGVEAWIS